MNFSGNDDGSALMAASRNGHSGVMRMLLQAGARVEMVHDYGIMLREVLDEYWEGGS